LGRQIGESEAFLLKLSFLGRGDIKNFESVAKGRNSSVIEADDSEEPVFVVENERKQKRAGLDE